MAVKPKIAKSESIEETCTCLSCGSVYKQQEGNFFKSTYSQLWNYNNKYFPVCKSCLDKMLKEYTDRYKSEESALMIICHYMDVPFYASLYQSIIQKNTTFSVGLYCRNLNQRQFQYKTFLNTLVDGELTKTNDEIKEEKEAKWTKKDKQNMNYVMSTFGYDPFDDIGMNDNDRRHCFNILAGYCDTEGIKDDGHKRLCCIQITNSQLQCKKIDEVINQELLSTNPNEVKIQKLTTAKKQLSDSIAKTAQDNNISSAYNASSKQGKNTLSSKMKQMEEDKFEAIKVNLFDIKTCESMKQIADLSNRSIMDQLTFDDNDYTEMIKEQREMILKYETDLDAFKEENRLLKNQVIELNREKKR